MRENSKGSGMNELKSCPFCGNRAGKIKSVKGMWVVYCYECNAKTEARKEEKVISLWNTRADVSIGMGREEAKKLFVKTYNYISNYNCVFDKEVEEYLDKLFNSIEPKNVVAELKGVPKDNNEVYTPGKSIESDDENISIHAALEFFGDDKVYKITIEEITK
jgi:Lar family restriction alleviation protein